MDKLKQKENSECDIFVVVDLFLFLISLLYFSYFKMVIKQDTVSRWVNAKGIYLFFTHVALRTLPHPPPLFSWITKSVLPVSHSLQAVSRT